jgi:uncharacterized protein (TIGR02001 family)
MAAYSIGMNRLATVLLLAWSGAAPGATIANAGAVSEYLLRGIEGSGGAALQGGFDWGGPLGAYAGAWGSNLGGPAAAGGTELDFYGGWAGMLGPVTVDVGAVYYCYPEDEEDLGLDYDYAEVYAKLGTGSLTLQLHYTTRFYGEANQAAADLAGRDSDGLYVNAVGTFPLAGTVDVAVQVGHSSGDGVEVAYGDRYSDYSVSLIKSLKDGWSVSFGLYNTTLKAGQGLGTLAGGDDDPKAVIGVKRTFEL